MIKEIELNLNSIENVKSFVDINTKFSGNIDVSSERYLVDGKSILGVFSLNLINPVKLTISADDDKDIEELLKQYSDLNLI